MAQINKPTNYFNTKLYTGNGSTQSITGVNFQPDLVWLKGRNVAYSSGLFDIIRGTGKHLTSNNANSDYTAANTLTAFNSDGFSLGNEVGFNENTSTFASWNWLAGGSPSSNTDGSITSSVSANTTSGFSIVSYSGNSTAGATIGHGLGTTPAMFIIKNRTTAGEHWVVYHKSISPSNMLYLNLTNAQDPANQFNSTAATSSVFSVGSNIMVNASSNNYIAYCFAEKKGFSKFGSYSGNSSTDGPMVYLGFKPSFLLIKDTGVGNEWEIYDNKRIGYNSANYHLNAHNTDIEATLSDRIDFLSNGFKLRAGPSGPINTTGNNYIYMAFAEQPLVGTNNIPATAR